VIRDQIAEDDSAVAFLYIKGAVVFGQTFVEPERHSRAHRVVDQQMDIFVEDRPERLIF
jgi:hypothetical protein